MEVVEAEKSDLDSFFVYLENQLSENGNGEVPLFQPMSSEQSEIPETTKDKFIQGFSHQFGDLGWRKLWAVKDISGNIKGHIDLRHHCDGSRSHRVLLGMGIDVSCRKQGLGQRLIDAVINLSRFVTLGIFGFNWLKCLRHNALGRRAALLTT